MCLTIGDLGKEDQAEIFNITEYRNINYDEQIELILKLIMQKVLLILFFLFNCSSTIHAQKISGTWEGYAGSSEKLKVCIKVKNNELCGYTADSELNDPSSFCKALFKGWYKKDEAIWILMGTSFLENSGEHILIYLRLWYQKGDPDGYLRGTIESKSGAVSIFNMGGGREKVILKKVSDRLPADMPDCFPVVKKTATKPVAKKIINKPAIKKVSPVKQSPVKKTVTVKPKNTVKPLIITATPERVKPVLPIPEPVKPITITSPPITANDFLISKMKARKKNSFSHIIVHERKLTLKVYDNGTVDNDSVSIFYNGKLIAEKKRLSEKPLQIDLELDENAPLHEITLFAENLGTIAPNTALIVVTAGKERFELHSSASLTENAVITFEYKPI